MALKSMTGFGEGVASADGVRVSVEMSSVNRKQLDINVNLPRNLATLDALGYEGLERSHFGGFVSNFIDDAGWNHNDALAVTQR